MCRARSHPSGGRRCPAHSPAARRAKRAAKKAAALAAAQGTPKQPFAVQAELPRTSEGDVDFDALLDARSSDATAEFAATQAWLAALPTDLHRLLAQIALDGDNGVRRWRGLDHSPHKAMWIEDLNDLAIEMAVPLPPTAPIQAGQVRRIRLRRAPPVGPLPAEVLASLTERERRAYLAQSAQPTRSSAYGCLALRWATPATDETRAARTAHAHALWGWLSGVVGLAILGRLAAHLAGVTGTSAPTSTDGSTTTTIPRGQR